MRATEANIRDASSKGIIIEQVHNKLSAASISCLVAARLTICRESTPANLLHSKPPAIKRRKTHIDAVTTMATKVFLRKKEHHLTRELR